jgi:hypothetical protein
MGLREALTRTPLWGRWLLAFIPVRVAMIPIIPILPEEAYHWNFARHLDWGYYDHPPMIAWAIAAGRAVLGDNAFGIRAVTVLFSLGTTSVLARMAKRFYGETAAVWAVILFTFAPVLLPVSAAGFPDSPLLFFWALTLALSWRAIEGQDGGRWLAAGAALGGAMLSKYTGVFLVPSVFLYLALSKRDRRWLATPWPYLAGVVALLVFSPVIYWNWQHQWASFLFQSRGRLEESRGFRPIYALQFVGKELLALLPLTLPLAFVAIRRRARSERPEERFLLAGLPPIVLVFGLISFFRPAHVLWAVPGFLGLFVVMAGHIAEGTDGIARFYARSRTLLLGVCFVGLIAGGIHLKYFLPFITPMQGLYGWEEVAQKVRALRAEEPAAVLMAFGRKYTVTSQLAFRLNLPYDVQGSHLIDDPALQYEYWCDPQTLRGRDALIVVEGGARATDTLQAVRKHFIALEAAGDVVVPVGRHLVFSEPPVTFLLFKGRGYIPPASK